LVLGLRGTGPRAGRRAAGRMFGARGQRAPGQGGQWTLCDVGGGGATAAGAGRAGAGVIARHGRPGWRDSAGL